MVRWANMSSPGQNFVDAPAIEPNASDAAYGRTAAPRTNQALALAQSLTDLIPNVQQLGAGIIKQQQTDAAVEAKKRAIELGGKPLADAVKSGEISPTQNPYWVQDYNRESAYVRASAAAAKVNTDSATWAERSDPAAFQARWAKEIAAIGADYNDTDSMEGFTAAVAPAQQQAFAAQSAEVSANMVAERNDNLSQLITTSLQGVSAKYHGNASPSQLETGLSGLKAHFLGTGGTEQEWNKLLYNGYTSAAYNSQDATILDAIPDGLKALPGIADQIATDKYHIEQASKQKVRDAYEDQNIADQNEGRSIAVGAFADPKYGPKLLTGDFDVRGYIQDQIGQGHSLPGILASLNKVAAGVQDSQALMEAKMRAYELDPTHSTYLFDLHTRASTEGYSDNLAFEVGQLVLRNDISAKDGDAFISQAMSTTNAKANPVAGSMVPRVIQKVNAKQFANLRQGLVGLATQVTSGINAAARVHHGRGMTPAEVANLQKLGVQAASAYLAQHQGDLQGALSIGTAAIGDWGTAHAADYYAVKGAK